MSAGGHIIIAGGSVTITALSATEELSARKWNQLTRATDGADPSSTVDCIFTVPYISNPLFVGRAADLRKIDKYLKHDRCIAVTGIGGLGKTQLVVEYAHHYRTSYPGGIFWLNMENPDAVVGQVAAVGGPGYLNLPQWNTLDSQGRIELVKAAWGAAEDRLLIFDNCEDLTVFHSWRPVSGGSRVVITTRRAIWPAHMGVHEFPLNTLPRKAAIQLLLEPRARRQKQVVKTLLSNPATMRTAEAICLELGDLPLGITLAATYLEVVTRLPLVKYLERLQKVMLDDPSFTPDLDEPLPTNHISSLGATFALSYDLLYGNKETDKLALILLHRAAQSTREPIPRRLLLDASGIDADEADSEAQAGPAIHRLATLGLLEELPDGNLRLHRLLAAFARQRSPDADGDAAAWMAAVQRILDRVAQTLQHLDWYLSERAFDLITRQNSSFSKSLDIFCLTL